MHVYIFTCELDCLGIDIHAFHMHWNGRTRRLGHWAQAGAGHRRALGHRLGRGRAV